jgi:hypothetical protein
VPPPTHEKRSRAQWVALKITGNHWTFYRDVGGPWEPARITVEVP